MLPSLQPFSCTCAAIPCSSMSANADVHDKKQLCVSSVTTLPSTPHSLGGVAAFSIPGRVSEEWIEDWGDMTDMCLIVACG